MIKPEVDLELSIKALKVYNIEPNIIKSMLNNLQKILEPCKCKSGNYGYGFAKCFDCGKIKQV